MGMVYLLANGTAPLGKGNPASVPQATPPTPPAGDSSGLPAYIPPKPLPPLSEDPTRKLADEQYQETLSKQQQDSAAARKKALDERNSVPLYTTAENNALTRANS